MPIENRRRSSSRRLLSMLAACGNALLDADQVHESEFQAPWPNAASSGGTALPDSSRSAFVSRAAAASRRRDRRSRPSRGNHAEFGDTFHASCAQGFCPSRRGYALVTRAPQYLVDEVGCRKRAHRRYQLPIRCANPASAAVAERAVSTPRRCALRETWTGAATAPAHRVFPAGRATRGAGTLATRRNAASSSGLTSRRRRYLTSPGKRGSPVSW